MKITGYNEDGSVEFTCTLAEWIEANPDMTEEADALSRGETVEVGGGAAAYFRNVPSEA